MIHQHIICIFRNMNISKLPLCGVTTFLHGPPYFLHKSPSYPLRHHTTCIDDDHLSVCNNLYCMNNLYWYNPNKMSQCVTEAHYQGNIPDSEESPGFEGHRHQASLLGLMLRMAPCCCRSKVRICDKNYELHHRTLSLLVLRNGNSRFSIVLSHNAASLLFK